MGKNFYTESREDIFKILLKKVYFPCSFSLGKADGIILCNLKLHAHEKIFLPACRYGIAI